MSYQLDRVRPLWELWFIEGIEHGRVAILVKLHHVLVDGASALALLEAMFADRAQSRRLTADTGKSRALHRPGLGRRALAAASNVSVLTPYRMVRLAQQALLQQRAVRGIANSPVRYFEAPITRFNAEVSPYRRVSRSRVPLDRVKAVNEAFGVKLNDIVLALVSGALRRYLQAREELPLKSLVAQIGISTRRDDAIWGNQITSAKVRLATHVADVAERVTTIHRETQSAKDRAQTLASHQRVGLMETIPPGLVTLAVGIWAASRLGRHFAPTNMVISNIRGPEFQRYIAGAAIEQQVPLGPLSVDIGLNITCNSSDGWIDFGFVTTPEIADDITELADAIEPALQALEEAAVLQHRPDHISATPRPR
jgi:diacylglycerol O-acyltransferase / wax synthase